MKSYFLITTQYLENYGGHCESGKFTDGKACWKFKGNFRYLISTDSPREANAVAFLTAYLHKGNSDIFSKEIVIEWEQVFADEHGWILDGDYTEIDIDEHFGANNPTEQAQHDDMTAERDAYLDKCDVGCHVTNPTEQSNKIDVTALRCHARFS